MLIAQCIDIKPFGASIAVTSAAVGRLARPAVLRGVAPCGAFKLGLGTCAGCSGRAAKHKGRATMVFRPPLPQPRPTMVFRPPLPQPRPTTVVLTESNRKCARRMKCARRTKPKPHPLTNRNPPTLIRESESHLPLPTPTNTNKTPNQGAHFMCHLRLSGLRHMRSNVQCYVRQSSSR